MKKLISLVLAFAIFFAGCAGREANPIPAYLPGDNERSCEVLVAEIAQLQADMQRILPKNNKGVTNTLWAIGGCLVIVPFFFMDLKDAEKIEFEAMRTRHNRLLLICADKGCNMTGVRAERIPSAKDAKKMLKQQGAESYKNKETRVIGNKTKCANCDNPIGRLEKVYVFEGNFVCAKCYSRLKEQKPSDKINTKDTTEDISTDNIGATFRDFWKHRDAGEIYLIEMSWQNVVVASYGPISGKLQPTDTYELTTEKNAELQKWRDNDKLIWLEVEQ